MGSGITPKSDDDRYYQDGTTSWPVSGDLADGTVSTKVNSVAVEKYSALNLWHAESLAIVMYRATIGKLGLLQYSTTTNQANYVLIVDNGNSPRFWFCVLLANRPRIVSLSYRGGQLNNNPDFLKSLRFACPKLEEQTVSRPLRISNTDPERVYKATEIRRLQKTAQRGEHVTPIIKKIHDAHTQLNPLTGLLFIAINGKSTVVEYESNPGQRDTEQIPPTGKRRHPSIPPPRGAVLRSRRLVQHVQRQNRLHSPFLPFSTHAPPRRNARCWYNRVRARD